MENENLSNETNEKPKTSLFAILSLTFGVLLWLFACIVFGQGLDAQQFSEKYSSGLMSFVVIGLGLFSVLGVIFGIVAIKKKNTRRILPVIGILLSSIPVCFIIVVMVLIISLKTDSKPPSLPFTFGDASTIDHLVLTTSDLNDIGLDFWEEDLEKPPFPYFEKNLCNLGCAGRSWKSNNGLLQISVVKFKNNEDTVKFTNLTVDSINQIGVAQKFNVDYLPGNTYTGFYGDDNYSTFILVSSEKNYMVTVWTFVGRSVDKDEDFQLFLRIITQLGQAQWQKINQ